MKNPLAAGLIAGVIGGILINVARILEAMLGLPSALPGMLSIETVLYHLGYEIGHIGILGAMCGLVYSRFHDAIPGKKLSKGLVFGGILYLIVNARVAAYWSAYGWTASADGLFYSGLAHFCIGIIWSIPYGLVLGALFEK